MPGWAGYHVGDLRDARDEHVATGWMGDELVRSEQADVCEVGAGLLVAGDAVQETWSQDGSIGTVVHRRDSIGAGNVLSALSLTRWRESDEGLSLAHIFDLSEVAGVGISW